MNTLLLSARALIAAGSLAAFVVVGAVPGFVPQTAQAATCVKFVASNFDAPGDDNYMPQLNQEWVRIKNSCGTAQSIGGWKIQDSGNIHTYKFASGTSIGAGASMTLHSGKGSNTATHKYWQRSYGAVWNNTGDRATLRNAGGTLMSSWSE
jgi:Lamin Tail Domain